MLLSDARAVVSTLIFVIVLIFLSLVPLRALPCLAVCCWTSIAVPRIRVSLINVPTRTFALCQA